MGDTDVASPRHRIAIQVAIAALCLVVVVAMALSSHAMSDIRVAFPPLSRAMSWLEGLDTPFDMDHVAFFTAMTFAERLLLPRVRWWWIALGVLLLAGGTELMQFGIAGRTPKLLDARDDLIGGVIGLLLASAVIWSGRFTPQMLALSQMLLLTGVVALPIQQWSPIALFGFPILLSDALLAAAIGTRTLAWMGGNAPLRLNAFHVWLAAYVVAMGLASMAAWPNPDASANIGLACPIPSPYMWSSVGKWLGIVYLAGLAALVADLARDPSTLKKFVLAWVAAAAVTSLFSMAAIVAFYVVPDAAWAQSLFNYYGSLPPGDYPRVRSLFVYASMLCSFLNVGICLLFAARAAGWVSERAFFLLLACLLIALAATVTPGLGGTFLILGVWAWASMRERSPAVARLLLGAGMVAALLMLGLACIRLALPMGEPSHRWLIWQQALDTWFWQPWRGVGLTVPVVGVAFDDPSGGHQYLTDAHNTWLSIAGQAGIFGLFALAGLCVRLLRIGSRAVRSSRVTVSLSSMLLLAFAIEFFYGGLTASLEDARHLWVLIGMLAAVTAAPASPYGRAST